MENLTPSPETKNTKTTSVTKSRPRDPKKDINQDLKRDINHKRMIGTTPEKVQSINDRKAQQRDGIKGRLAQETNMEQDPGVRKISGQEDIHHIDQDPKVPADPRLETKRIGQDHHPKKENQETGTQRQMHQNQQNKTDNSQGTTKYYMKKQKDSWTLNVK